MDIVKVQEDSAVSSYSAMSADLREELTNWVFGPLSERSPELGGMAPCPYAAEAMLAKQVAFFSGGSALRSSLECLLRDFSRFGCRVAILSWNQCMDYDSMSAMVKELREESFGSDLWLMFDHPDNREFVGSVNMSFEKTTLFFIQRLTDLCEGSDALKSSGYYDNWSEDYYRKVVSQRQAFLNRLKT